MASIKRAVFPELVTLRIAGWFWAPSDNRLNLFFRNGKSYQFLSSAGHSWSFDNDGDIVYIAGWTIDEVRQCARQGGTVLPAENELRFCFPQSPVLVPAPPVGPDQTFVIPEVPIDEFSLDLGSDWDDDSWTAPMDSPILFETFEELEQIDLHEIQRDENRRRSGYDVELLRTARRQLFTD